MESIQLDIKNLSSHLFWDVDKSKLDIEKSKKLIIGRVLDYGLINDWYSICNYYGINEIANVATKIKNLDLKSMSFVSLLSNLQHENFLCYSTAQSNLKHWNF